jgi:hypothetical protein
MPMLSRLWSIVVGLVMIALSLFLQLLIFLIIGLITIPMFLPRLNPFVAIVGLLLVFNGVSCFEYFWRRRVVGLGNTIHRLEGMVKPDSSHVSMALFLVPRGIDRIITGRELTVSGTSRHSAQDTEDLPAVPLD